MNIYRRWSLMICLALFLTGTVFASTAKGDCEGGATVQSSDWLGTVRTMVQCPSSSGTPSNRTESRTCNSQAGAPIPCRTAQGTWNADKSCYSQQTSPEVIIPDDPSGDREGIVMLCTTLGGSTFDYLAPPDQPQPPDPRQLAQAAISRMDLHAIRIGSFPHTVEKSPMSLGVVGWNAWMWVEGASASTYGPVTKSASAAGYTVTATAQVVEVVWDMGNGDTVTCGKGTPYPATTETDPVSPDCGYRYTHDGRYTITATARWNITWAGIGQSGVIPMELATTGQLAIAEIQVLNVPVHQS